MSNTREFYAWVKTLDSTGARPVAAQTEPPLTPETLPRLEIMSGHRPPGVGSLEPYAKGVNIFYDTSSKTQILLADPLLHGDWDVDPSFTGTKGQQFELLHFVGSRAEAIEWMQTDEGKRWRSNALNIGLLRFESPPLCTPSDPQDDSSAQAQPCPPPASKSDASGPGLAGACPAFTEAEWRFDYRKFVDEAPVLFSSAEIQRLTLPPPQTIALGDECAEVRAAVARMPARLKQIREQSSDIRALVHIVDPEEHGFEKPATLALMDLLRRSLRRPIFQLKWQHQRGRPWVCCKGLTTAFPPGDPYFPAHAAYPAGHATLACVAAALMSKTVPALEKDYWQRAERVMENRIIGGFHWPSDNEGGRLLAAQLLPLLLAKDEVQKLLADLAKEW